MVSDLCIRCKGKGLCGKPCVILNKFKENAPKVKLHFSGSSPPEIFVGRNDYPNVFSGILAPAEIGNTSILSTPEQWYKKNLSIEEILELRGSLVYGRSKYHIKSSKSIKQVTQGIAMSSSPVSIEFFLKKKPVFNFTPSKIFSIMTNPAPLKKVILEENPKIEKKVDYLVSDTDVKSVTALKELYEAKLTTTHLQKILSAGLLGRKTQRKMVPTRWAITAVDDTLSKQLLQKIRNYPTINEILLFNGDYNGNHYEILLLPETFSFEVIEAELPGNVWNPTQNISFMQDSEEFFGRKNYASNVTGAYYANRLGVCEYLIKQKKQATAIVLREIRPEYYAPLGVGILRELTRGTLSKKPEKVESLKQAFKIIQTRLKIPILEFIKNSKLIKNYGKQKKLSQFI